MLPCGHDWDRKITRYQASLGFMARLVSKSEKMHNWGTNLLWMHINKGKKLLSKTIFIKGIAQWVEYLPGMNKALMGHDLCTHKLESWSMPIIPTLGMSRQEDQKCSHPYLLVSSKQAWAVGEFVQKNKNKCCSPYDSSHETIWKMIRYEDHENATDSQKDGINRRPEVCLDLYTIL